MAFVLFGVVWSITEKECLPGRNLFGIVVLFISAVYGGNLVGLIQFPSLPPFPPLLGMLLAGILLHNIPVVSDAVYVDVRWSAALRNISLAVILTRAGLGLDAAALKKLKAVCLRVAVGPCTVEACTVAVISHFLMALPWIWAFMLGFVLGAVSPAVVVPSMLLLQRDGYGVEKGIPTLLMAAGSFDDILAITGFTTCLGVAFATGATWYNLLKGILEVAGGMVAGLLLGCFLCFFPSEDQEDLVIRRSFLLLGLSVFAVFASRVAGFPGAGGLCTLVMAFMAGLSWKLSKAPVAAVVGRIWDVFQPLLFGLIGAEITVSALDPSTVGLGLAALSAGLMMRVLFTFAMVLFAGFSFKEKVFTALAWIPKATVQAAIGSTALDTARRQGDPVLEKYGMDILTVAVLAILITAPIGAVSIGLAGPRLLQKQVDPNARDRCPEGDRPPLQLTSYIFFQLMSVYIKLTKDLAVYYKDSFIYTLNIKCENAKTDNRLLFHMKKVTFQVHTCLPQLQGVACFAKSAILAEYVFTFYYLLIVTLCEDTGTPAELTSEQTVVSESNI
ncbi:mitochondrial sodium/hydrogen exchanger 9B2-like [Arapaima gigas]